MTRPFFAAHLTTIPHDMQRYPTTGDWEFNDTPGEVRIDIHVSDTNSWRRAALLAVHELIESLLCRHAGITQAAVDAFDRAHLDADEPGDLPDCPYRDQHRFATVVEKLLAAELGVDWREYCAALEALE